MLCGASEIEKTLSVWLFGRSQLRVNKQREKLEELCRELQKQNKAVQDESKRRSEEEHKRREELSEKFQVRVLLKSVPSTSTTV